MNNFNKLNFHKRTYCEFKMVQIDFFNEKSIHYKSKSGSLYHYTKNGVYRYSNHWGRVANCRWKIVGIEDYKNQYYYVGYANWFSFFNLDSNRKSFYLEVDYNSGISKISYKLENDSAQNYLMTLDFAFKRQKEIKLLFKNEKWARYHDVTIEVLRKRIIKKLINSNSPFKEIKRIFKFQN